MNHEADSEEDSKVDSSVKISSPPLSSLMRDTRRVTTSQFASNNLVGKIIADLRCDEAIEWSRAESRIIPTFGEPYAHVTVNMELDASVVETLLQLPKRISTISRRGVELQSFKDDE